MQFEVKVIENAIVLCSEGSSKSYEFPQIWLRDNCLCDMCYNPTTYTRTIDWDNFDFDVSSKRANVCNINCILYLCNDIFYFVVQWEIKET